MSTDTKPPIPEPVQTRSEANGLRRVRAERAPFDLRGTEWAQFGQAGTSLFLAVTDDRRAVSVRLLLEDYPSGAPALGRTLGTVAWHSLPTDEDPQDEVAECDLLPGGKCVAGVSYLAGDLPGELYDSGGEDAVWTWLENEHRNDDKGQP